MLRHLGRVISINSPFRFWSNWTGQDKTAGVFAYWKVLSFEEDTCIQKRTVMIGKQIREKSSASRDPKTRSLPNHIPRHDSECLASGEYDGLRREGIGEKDV